MDDKNPQTNVLQFPSRKKEAPELPKNEATKVKKKKTPAPKSSQRTLAGSVLAIVLATVAVNRIAFREMSLADTHEQISLRRSIASVDSRSPVRDAAWEKELAEKLANPDLRESSSASIGVSANKEDTLRWGILESKYTISYRSDSHNIESVMLQGDMTSPSYVRDRVEFLREYGALLDSSFSSFELKSVETADGKIIELYSLLNRDKKATCLARFELDRYKRLLSLKVEEPKI